jgi:hypothetical protein
LFFFQAGSQVAFSMHIKTRVFQYDYSIPVSLCKRHRPSSLGPRTCRFILFKPQILKKRRQLKDIVQMIVLPLFIIRFKLYMLAPTLFMLLQLRHLTHFNIKPPFRAFLILCDMHSNERPRHPVLICFDHRLSNPASLYAGTDIFAIIDGRLQKI